MVVAASVLAQLLVDFVHLGANMLDQVLSVLELLLLEQLLLVLVIL